MDMLSAVIHDWRVNKMNKKKEWIVGATYISGHPSVGSGNLLVVLRLTMDGLTVHKRGAWKGLGEILFVIPANKIVSISGDGTYYSFTDDNFTQRQMIVTALAEDDNGNQYNVPIKFDTYWPWMIIPKVTFVMNQARGIRI